MTDFDNIGWAVWTEETQGFADRCDAVCDYAYAGDPPAYLVFLYDSPLDPHLHPPGVHWDLSDAPEVVRRVAEEWA